MLKELIDGLLEKPAMVAGRAWLVGALPWIAGILAAAGAALALYVASLHVQIAKLERDVATAKAKTSKCTAEFTEHLRLDEQALIAAIRQRQEKEAGDRAERDRIIQEGRRVRDALQHENDRLRGELRSGTSVRVRSALCSAPATAEGGAGVRAVGTPAGSSPPGPVPSGADLVADAIGAGFQKDALYDELYEIAVSDRKTCGVRRS